MRNEVSRVPVLILAGGLGTRLSEETQLRPKPMIEIGEIPLLIHIMRSYYFHGFNDFVICAGYKAWEIKKYFLTYEVRSNHLEIDHRALLSNPPRTLGKNLLQEKWRVRILDTGLNAMTGARVARAIDEIAQTDEFEHFAVTYGDGLCDADFRAEFDFHVAHRKIGTVLGVKNSARYGELDVCSDNRVEGFLEKPESRQGYINGGFFFFRSAFRNYLGADAPTVLEREPLHQLAQDNQLMVYKHHGFWAAMDTLRDKMRLQALWETNHAPWLSPTCREPVLPMTHAHPAAAYPAFDGRKGLEQ